MKKVRTRRRSWPWRPKLTPATATVLFAVVVGILGGVGALLFKQLILLLQGVFWATPDMTPGSLYAVAWYRRLLMPALGGAMVGPLIYFLAREAKGHGVPEVMIAVITRNSVIRPIVVAVKIVASALSIASGGSVGREGPIVQIGAAIGSTAGQFFRVRPAQLKTLVGCGAAAGIAAVFNAPMAGTLFALELIVSDFGLTAFTPILVSAVAATAVTRHFHGNIIEFTLPPFAVVSIWEMGLYLVLGLLAGVVGYVFSRSVYLAEDACERRWIPQWIRPASGGLFVGVVALGFPHVMGVGYDTVHALFDGELGLRLVLALVVLKIAATAVTVGSGGSGGVFTPSLFVGAMLGAAFGMVVHRLFPQTTAPFGAYALVGMAAVNGACTLAPLSAIVVLVELTNEYAMLLPLMLAVTMASFISRKLSPESVYTERLRRRGINAHHGEDLNILRGIPVADVLRHDEASILADDSFDTLVSLALNTRRNVLFVLDGQGRYAGVVLLQDLKYTFNDPEELKRTYHVLDFVQEVAPVLVAESLDTVVDRFAETGLDRLPVVDAERRIVGSILASDTMRRYTREVVNRNMAIELGARIAAHDSSGILHIGGHTVVTEIDAPPWMIGCKLAELELRARHNVSVFIVRQKQDRQDPRFITPNAAYTFRPGDRLLVGGTEDDIEALRARLD